MDLRVVDVAEYAALLWVGIDVYRRLRLAGLGEDECFEGRIYAWQCTNLQ